MTEKSAHFELFEPSSPEALVPDSWLEPWMMAATALVILALLALVILKKNKPVTPDPLTAQQVARAEAAAALGQIGAVSARDAAVQSSLILRQYLAVAAGDPALFETHEEYLSRHQALQAFSEDARSAAGLGFSRLAAIKYSAATPELSTGQVITGALALLEVLRHGFKA